MNGVAVPDDLQQYLANHDYPYDTSTTESPAANVRSKRISSRLTAFFPDTSTGQTAVFFHIPGGFGQVSQADISWVSSLSKELQCISITGDRIALIPDTNDPADCLIDNCQTCLERDLFDRALSDSEYDFKIVCDLCSGRWKETWGTNEKRIYLSGSSIGGTLALILASAAEEDGQPVCGVVVFVPLIDTNPDLKGNPWGSVEDSPGLTPERLLTSLGATLKHAESRDDWRKNPSKWSDSRVGLMASTVFAFARHDILYPSGFDFMTRMLRQGVPTSHIIVDGIHQVKDMNRITEAGGQVRKFVMDWCARHI